MRVRIDGIVHATRPDLIANPYQNIPEFYVTCGAASRAYRCTDDVIVTCLACVVAEDTFRRDLDALLSAFGSSSMLMAMADSILDKHRT